MTSLIDPSLQAILMIRDNKELLPEATYLLDNVLTPFVEELEDSFQNAPDPSSTRDDEWWDWDAKADAGQAGIELQERFPSLFTRRYVDASFS